MNTTDIIAEAKKRLAELDAERDKLLRIIAAAEGVEPVRLTSPLPIDIAGGVCVVTGTAFSGDEIERAKKMLGITSDGLTLTATSGYVHTGEETTEGVRVPLGPSLTRYAS